MNKSEIQKLLKPIIWDYNLDPYDLFELVVGTKKQAGNFTPETALVRMLERLSWYDLVNLFGIEALTHLITPEIISRLRLRELQEKYEFVRKVLQGETVSFSGWSPEYREKIRHTLLSDRWYRTQPGIF
jgi:hypothetical protein